MVLERSHTRQPVDGGIEDVGLKFRANLHHHFVPHKDPDVRKEQIKAFWRAVYEARLDAVGLLTHSNISVGFTPESIYNELMDARPPILEKLGVRLLAGMEVLCKPNRMEVGIISSNPMELYGDDFWTATPTVDEVGEHIHGNSKLLGFLPHPFLSKGGVAANLGVEQARELVVKYDLGVEFLGLIRDVRILARTPGVKYLLGKTGEKYREIEENLETSGLVDAADFITVGGDYHDPRHMERAYIVIHLGSQGKQVVDVNAAGNNVVFQASTTNPMWDVTDKMMIDGIRDGKQTAEVKLRPLEEGNVKLLLHNTRVLAREVLMRRREKRLVRPEDL